jgi:hypothetical protein
MNAIRFIFLLVLVNCNSLRIEMKVAKESKTKGKVIYLDSSLYWPDKLQTDWYWNMKDSCPLGMSIGEIEFKYGRAESVVCYEKEKK